MPDSSKSKIILITGCDSGFGMLTASRLAQKGHQVIATLLNIQNKNELQSELNKVGVSLSGIHQMDVRDKASVARTVSEVAEQHGYVDVLINNAGIGMGGSFEDLSEEDIRNVMETNFFGVQNVTRKIIPLMRPRKCGTIINISSEFGLYSPPFFSAYNCSKWALEAFSESLKYELQFFGIKVFLIEPSLYRTKIFFENARRAKNFNNPGSPYFLISKHIEQRVLNYVRSLRRPLENIPELIEKLIDSGHAPFRNFPDWQGRSMYLLRKILPYSSFQWLVEKALYKGLK